MGYQSKFSKYDEKVKELVLSDSKYRKSNSLIVEKILGKKDGYNTEFNSFRIYLNRNLKAILDEHDVIYEANNN